MQQTAIIGAGCFWGVEEHFRQLDGVLSTKVGYSGGHVGNPTYEQVCGGDTGHAEVLQIMFDAERLSYDRLLEEFWQIHDPTTFHRQGPDVGSQYRSIIFYQDETQRQTAEASKAKQQAKLSRPIVTEIVPAAPFYEAEDYHQQYLAKRGAKVCH